jgi:enoyl-CoA hydratase/carnithine racemase
MTIRLNRPDQKNAFTFSMVHAWADLIDEAASNDDIRVVVVTGSGDSFCSGVDLGSISNADASLTPLARKSQLHDEIHKVARALERCDTPVIAALNGSAVGAGLDMALMCDMRIAKRSAKFSEGYIRVGLVPGDGGAWYLPRLVGASKAMELLLTGRFVGAEEAERIGMVNTVVDDDAFDAEVAAWAKAIAAQPPVSVRTIKRLVTQAENLELRTALDLVSSHFAVVASTEDAAEALAAFREKRTATFKGR